jgi:ABC-type siderophore export system fused ATPase/permease subunit
MTQEVLSMEEVYQKGIKELNQELYRAYNRINELQKELTLTRKKCKQLLLQEALNYESLVNLPLLKEPY